MSTKRERQYIHLMWRWETFKDPLSRIRAMDIRSCASDKNEAWAYFSDALDYLKLAVRSDNYGVKKSNFIMMKHLFESAETYGQVESCKYLEFIAMVEMVEKNMSPEATVEWQGQYLQIFGKQG